MTDHAEALAKALEPGELSDERIKELAEAFQTHATRFAHDEICPERDLVSALAELAAYRSRPAAEVVARFAKLSADPRAVIREDAEPTLGYLSTAELYATPAPVAGTEPAGEVVEKRPANCRNRLRDEGKAYPKSGCAVCKTGGMTGCPHERAALGDQSEA